MKVFVSYRRDDTQDFAGRLVDRLRAALGIAAVFLDVEGIMPGENFETKLKAALGGCDLCLVLVGREWRGARPDRPVARIEEPGDFVRLEVREALASPAKVIPVLANGAVMPDPRDLPEDLRGLASLNALSIRHSDFNRDVDHLLDVIFSRRGPSRFGSHLARHPVQAGVLRSAVGLFLALIALLAVAVVNNTITNQSLNQTVGGTGPALLLIAAVIFAGLMLPHVLRGSRRRRAGGR